MNCSWVIFIDREVDKVLILKRSKSVRNPKQWCFPGGSSKKRSKKKLARAEALEEVGIKLKKSHLNKFIDIDLKNKEYNYYVVFSTTARLINLDKESSKFKWVKLKSLEHHKNQHQSIRRFVKFVNDNKYKLLEEL